MKRFLNIVCDTFKYLEDTTIIAIGIILYFIVSLVVKIVTGIHFVFALLCTGGAAFFIFTTGCVIHFLYEGVIDVIDTVKYAKDLNPPGKTK